MGTSPSSCEGKPLSSTMVPTAACGVDAICVWQLIIAIIFVTFLSMFLELYVLLLPDEYVENIST